jgi:hypothetical protein
MEYRIYPPLGIARIGNHALEFFIGAETPRSAGTELINGTEQQVTEYKSGDTGDPTTSYRVKRQAARFRIYEIDPATGAGRPATFLPNTKIEWTVHLVNKKDAVRRPPVPPAAPIAVQLEPGRENRVIDGGKQTITAGQAAVIEGSYLGHKVKLGDLRTDPSGNLLVLGGSGISKTYEGAPMGADFYNNPGWHDDVSDGPVTAKITLPDGSVVDATPAWVVTAPPDFAPAVRGVVTLYDRMLQAAITAGLAAAPGKPSFTRDILPLLERARGLRWVHDNAAWKVAMDFNALSNVGAAAAAKRTQAAKVVRTVQPVLTHNDYTFHLCQWQLDVLDKFEQGNFEADFGSAPASDPTSPQVFTRAVLDGTVGEGFFPGIEAGIIVTDAARYAKPFELRLDHAKITAGDITALMAQPWQADFKKCATGWWPTQRPNKVPPLQPPRKEWDRNVGDHQQWVDSAMKLGVITRRPDVAGAEVQEESRRDPALG